MELCPLRYGSYAQENVTRGPVSPQLDKHVKTLHRCLRTACDLPHWISTADIQLLVLTLERLYRQAELCCWAVIAVPQNAPLTKPMELLRRVCGGRSWLRLAEAQGHGGTVLNECSMTQPLCMHLKGTYSP